MLGKFDGFEWRGRIERHGDFFEHSLEITVLQANLHIGLVIELAILI